MTWARHCDQEDCDTWERYDSGLPNHWVDALLNHPNDSEIKHFCTIDCMMKWAAANSSPTTVIEGEL